MISSAVVSLRGARQTAPPTDFATGSMVTYAPEGRLIDPITFTHALCGSGWRVLAVTASDDDETEAGVIAAGAVGPCRGASSDWTRGSWRSCGYA